MAANATAQTKVREAEAKAENEDLLSEDSQLQQPEASKAAEKTSGEELAKAAGAAVDDAEVTSEDIFRQAEEEDMEEVAKRDLGAL